MKVRFKKLHPDAVTPTYAHDTDAGMDMTAINKHIDEYGACVYGTGLAFEIPEGYVGLLFPRSSISKTRQALANCVGVIDSGYRGEVTFKFKGIGARYELLGSKPTETWDYEVGDRIGQLIIMPYPHIELEEADELSNSDRGNGGYGSTGK